MLIWFQLFSISIFFLGAELYSLRLRSGTDLSSDHLSVEAARGCLQDAVSYVQSHKYLGVNGRFSIGLKTVLISVAVAATEDLGGTLVVWPLTPWLIWLNWLGNHQVFRMMPILPILLIAPVNEFHKNRISDTLSFINYLFRTRGSARLIKQGQLAYTPEDSVRRHV